jgi:DNA-binding transcriptional ArsR family regulator
MRQAPPRPAAERLSATFAALADPTRRLILSRLISGATSVNELAEPHDMSLPAISKHLKVLERSGLITRSRDAQTRPCQLEAAPLKEAVDWLEGYRRHWEQSFDRLDEYLRQLQGKTKESVGKKITAAPIAGTTTALSGSPVSRKRK